MKLSLIPDCCVIDKGLIDSEVIGPESIDNLSDLSQLALEFYIACGVFKDNQRSNSNLVSNDFVCFDLDNGAIKSKTVHVQLLTDNIKHLVLGSKNHLKDKGDGKGVIERFHLFVPVDMSITSPSLYKEVIRDLLAYYQWPVDPACKDAARYFTKHSCQLFIHDTDWSRPYSYQKTINRLEAERLKQKQQYSVEQITTDPWKLFQNARCKSGHTLPSGTNYYNYVCQGGLSSDGNRHAVCMAVIGAAKLCGVDRYTIETFICQHSSWGKRYSRETVSKLIKSFY